MKLGMIGLGRMGGNMATRLEKGGHEVVGYDRAADSGRDVDSLEALASALENGGASPRVVWVMGPAGAPTADTIAQLANLLSEGDIVIDGGNSKYTDDAHSAEVLKAHGVHFLDVGVSGGVWGITNGYALMAGGDTADFEAVRPILETLKPEGDAGLVLAGGVGAGHFAKMVHNGIEYGMMQAMGEGFETLLASDLIDSTADVIDSWREGSVVKSWLLDLLADSLKKDPELQSFPPVANESGEAKWMVEAALQLSVPTPAVVASLYARQVSRGGGDDTLRAVTAMRSQFGGHVTKA